MKDFVVSADDLRNDSGEEDGERDSEVQVPRWWVSC